MGSVASEHLMRVLPNTGKGDGQDDVDYYCRYQGWGCSGFGPAADEGRAGVRRLIE